MKKEVTNDVRHANDSLLIYRKNEKALKLRAGLRKWIVSVPPFLLLDAEKHHL